MCFGIPGNTRRLPNVVLMLRQRHRRWTTIKTALGQCPLFAGMVRVVLGQYNPAAKKHFVSLKLEGQGGVRTRDVRLFKQAALITAPGPRPEMIVSVKTNLTNL